MRIFSVFILAMFSLSIFAQGTKPEIEGKLSTGQLLTGVFPNIFIIAYSWRTANDAAGTLGLVEVGKQKTYRLAAGDAGKYIRFEVTTLGLGGQGQTYYSDWYGPIKNGVPLVSGSVTITGTLKAGNTLTATYIYDPNNYPESGSTYNWYQAETNTGTSPVLISSSGPTLVLPAASADKYIMVEVLPHDSEGSSGQKYASSWYGPVQKPNQPPVATNVKIAGNAVICGVLTGTYTYSDPDQDAEGSSLFRWLRASNAGETPVAIPNATTKTYTVTADDQNKYLYFEVTPKAAAGISDGVAVLSSPTSPVQNTLPTVKFGGGATICQGASATIALSFTGTPPFKLDYTNGSANFNITSSSTTYQLKVTSGGTYKGVKLTDNLNCPVTNLPSSASVSVKPKTEVNFSVENTCWSADSTIFKNTTSRVDSIKNWSWNFGDNAAPDNQNKSSLLAPKHKYPAAGSYKVQLIGENNAGCKDTTSNTIVLGSKPTADFTWDRECFDAGKTTNFKDLSVSNGKVSKYNWTILSGNTIIRESATATLNNAMPSPGEYLIKLRIQTETGCQDSISKVLRVKPVYSLKDSFYSNSFEGINTGWTILQNSKNNWYWGNPDGQTIKTPNSPSHAYYTSFPEQRQNQQIEISGPCFSFTNVQKPFIELWINYNAQQSTEGAVLQYVQDGESAWKNVGEYNTGTNWFNNNNIASKPGNQQIGWSGNSNGWIQAKQDLTSLSNKTGIRFRMVYSSSASATSNDGFAFDDIFVGQRAKKVLIEHFTNLSDANSSRSNIKMDSVLMATGLSAVSIQYHTSFPGADSLNDQNTSHPAARLLYYGIGNIPSAYMDGGFTPGYIYNFTTSIPNVADINSRSLIEPAFDIKISSGIANNIISGNVRITALKNIPYSENALYIAIVEDISVVSVGNTSVLHNVLKYLYPSASGTTLAMSWTKDGTYDVPFSWPLQHVYNPLKLKVVAFIQNNATKEVFQVNIANNSAITSTPPELEQKLSLMVYPNPASGAAVISFGEELNEGFEMEILTKEGKILRNISIPKGTSSMELTLNEIPQGIYLLRVFNKEGRSRTAKLAIER